MGSPDLGYGLIQDPGFIRLPPCFMVLLFRGWPKTGYPGIGVPRIRVSPAAAEQLLGIQGNGVTLVPGLMLKPGTSITPMEKYDAENAKLWVVDVLPLMRILLVDVWDPSAGEMLVTWILLLAC